MFYEICYVFFSGFVFTTVKEKVRIETFNDRGGIFLSLTVEQSSSEESRIDCCSCTRYLEKF